MPAAMIAMVCTRPEAALLDADLDIDDGVLLADVTDIRNVNALLFGQPQVPQHLPDAPKA